MHIVIGADHAGYGLKEALKSHLTASGHQIVDVGTDSTESVDYPDFAYAVARAIMEGRVERGILVCGSGVGASIAANKIVGVRAAICHDLYSAAQGVEHDDMNVLTLGSRVVPVDVAKRLVETFLNATFSKEDRHARRLAKVLAIEQKYSRH